MEEIRRRFFKKFTMDDDDGRQVMAIAHMTLWVRLLVTVHIILDQDVGY
jgi:hypothetical protein